MKIEKTVRLWLVFDIWEEDVGACDCFCVNVVQCCRLGYVELNCIIIELLQSLNMHEIGFEKLYFI